MTALDDDKPTPRGELTLQIIPLPSDTNANGDVFAGWLVTQMDLAAATMAGRISQGRNATVAMDRMEFLSPLRVGSGTYTHVTLPTSATGSISTVTRH